MCKINLTEMSNWGDNVVRITKTDNISKVSQ